MCPAGYDLKNMDIFLNLIKSWMNFTGFLIICSWDKNTYEKYPVVLAKNALPKGSLC